MNKKGFTLIEVIVSIVLVSVVMTSLLATLVQIKNAQTIVHENSDAIIYASSITRILNNDIIENNGIRYISCLERNSNSSCDMILGNGKKRHLSIERYEKGMSDILSSSTNYYKTNKIYTTLTYYDENNNLKYIKTLSTETSTKYSKDGNDYVETEEKTSTNFIFSNKIDYKVSENYNPKTSGMEGIITTIKIGFIDDSKIDENETVHDFTLVSSATFNNESVNKKILYKITLDNSGVSNIANKNDLLDHFYEEYYAEYNSGFYKKPGELLSNNSITPPITTSGKKAAYYTQTEGKGKKVIDENGNIIVGPVFFDKDTTIYAYVAQ